MNHQQEVQAFWPGAAITTYPDGSGRVFIATRTEGLLHWCSRPFLAGTPDEVLWEDAYGRMERQREMDARILEEEG